MDKRKQTILYWGICFCFALIAWWGMGIGAWYVVIEGVGKLLSGEVRSIALSEQLAWRGTISIVSALIVVDMMMSPLVNRVVKTLIGDSPRSTARARYWLRKTSFLLVLIIVICEEMVARELCLRLIPKLEFFSRERAFYVLFIIGNSAWSLYHYTNTVEEDRHVLRVLPQFMGGILLTYCFVVFGFWMTVGVHFIHNAVLMMMCKLYPDDGGYAYA